MELGKMLIDVHMDVHMHTHVHTIRTHAHTHRTCTPCTQVGINGKMLLGSCTSSCGQV